MLRIQGGWGQAVYLTHTDHVHSFLSELFLAATMLFSLKICIITPNIAPNVVQLASC